MNSDSKMNSDTIYSLIPQENIITVTFESSWNSLVSVFGLVGAAEEGHIEIVKEILEKEIPKLQISEDTLRTFINSSLINASEKGHL